MATMFRVEIDWRGTGAWTDETVYVRRINIRSGFDRSGDLVAGIGRAMIVLDNHAGRFSAGNPNSPLYGNLVPRREVRITASDGVSSWPLFRGFIERLTPDGGKWSPGMVLIECVDGLALLSAERVSVAHEDTKAVDQAVDALVGDVYTPPATAYGENGDLLEHYGYAWPPEHTTVIDALRSVARNVYGRFYVARDGTATFKTRTELQSYTGDSAATFGEAIISAYAEKLKGIEAASLAAFWPLWETYGAVAFDESGNNLEALAYGVTWEQPGIGDNKPSVLLDGINDYIELPLTGFDKTAGALAAWVKLDADALTDGAQRYVVQYAADADNLVGIRKGVTDNTVEFVYCAAGTWYTVQAAISDSEWHHLAITWDTAAGEIAGYLDGAEAGTHSGVPAFSGAVADGVIGAAASDSNYWSGWLARLALWSLALGASDIASLAEV